MASMYLNPEKSDAAPPPPTWSDPIVGWIRKNRIVVAIYFWLSRRLVPFLFAVFVAAPIGLLILPFFIPKFLRNAQRRRKYGVSLSSTKIERIHGVSSEAPLAERADRKGLQD